MDTNEAIALLDKIPPVEGTAWGDAIIACREAARGKLGPASAYIKTIREYIEQAPTIYEGGAKGLVCLADKQRALAAIDHIESQEGAPVDWSDVTGDMFKPQDAAAQDARELYDSVMCSDESFASAEIERFAQRRAKTVRSRAIEECRVALGDLSAVELASWTIVERTLDALKEADHA